MSKRKDDNFLITPADLVAIHPFFDSYVGKGMANVLIKWLNVNKLNEVHAKYCHFDKYEMTSAILSDPLIDVKYNVVHGKEHLEMMSEMGAFHTISNHPYGGLDGVILIDLITRVRPDFRVLVNEFLTRVSGLADVWIPVSPPVNKKDYVHDPTKNVYGIKKVAECVMSGAPVGMFPAGGVPRYDKTLKRPVEQEWQLNNVRIVRASSIPIFPIAFSGDNSKKYFWVGEKINYQVASLFLPSEITNKGGRTINVYVGEPIMPDEIKEYKDLKSLRDFLRMRTLGMLPDYKDLVKKV